MGASIVAIASVGVSVSMAASSVAASTTSVTEYATGATNVRSGASTSNAVVGLLSAGTKVTGALQSNGWIKIATPSNFAGTYVSGSVLSSAAPATPKATPTSGQVTGWVRGDDLARFKVTIQVNVRSAPSSASPVVGHVAAGAKVTGQLANGWVHTTRGYVNAGVLEFASSDVYVNNARMPQNDLCAIPTKYNSSLTFSVVSPDTKKRYSYTSSTVRQIHCAALPSLVALEESYRKDRGHYAPIDLAYRGWDEQRAWATDSRYHGSPAGRSNHGWGLAVDFEDDDSAHDGTNEYADNGAGYAWMTKNAATFGYAVDPIVNAPSGYRPTYWRSETFHWNFIG